MATDKEALPLVGRLFSRGKRQYFSERPGEGTPLTPREPALALVKNLRVELHSLKQRAGRLQLDVEAAHARPAVAASTSTTTTADLEVTLPVFAEVAGKLRAVGYHVDDDGIDMAGIRLTCGAPAGDPSPDCDPVNICQPCRCKFARQGGR